MTTVWLIIMVLSFIAEIGTLALVSIWFCIGAAVALFLSISGQTATVQIVAFSVVSLLSLALSIKFMRKQVKKPEGECNDNIKIKDNLIGTKVNILKEVTDSDGSVVTDNGAIWRAFTRDGKVITKGRATVISIQGNRLEVTVYQEGERNL